MLVLRFHDGVSPKIGTSNYADDKRIKGQNASCVIKNIDIFASVSRWQAKINKLSFHDFILA